MVFVEGDTPPQLNLQNEFLLEKQGPFGDRHDYWISAPQTDKDLSFSLRITGTAVTLWQQQSIDEEQAVRAIADTLISAGAQMQGQYQVSSDLPYFDILSLVRAQGEQALRLDS